MKRVTGWMVAVVAVVMGLCVGFADAAPVTGSLGPSSGIEATGGWDGAFQIAWSIEQQTDGSWFYQYTYSDGQGKALPKDLSHAILAVSTSATPDDFYGFAGDIANEEKPGEGHEGLAVELRTFQPSDPGKSNPNLPGTIANGLKTDMSGAASVVSFYSSRQPMWTDFYAKDGVDNLGKGNKVDVTAWNADFGVAVANPNDFLNPAEDVDGNALAKILAPNTIETTPPTSTQPVPTPAAAMLIAWIGAGLALRRPTHRG